MFCSCFAAPSPKPRLSYAELEEYDHANKVFLQLHCAGETAMQRFQTCLDSLLPGDVIHLEVLCTGETPSLLNELPLPLVHRVRWITLYDVAAFEFDTEPILKFIAKNPQVIALSLFGKRFPSLQFATTVLQLATQNIRVLHIHPHDTRHFSQFLQALSCSKVMRFDLRGVDYAPYQRQLAKYVVLDKLQSLSLSIVDSTNERIIFQAISRCVVLKELQLSSTLNFTTISALPQSLMKLTLISCKLDAGASNKFCAYLPTSLITHLWLSGVRGLNCAELGEALSHSLHHVQYLDISFLQNVDNLMPALCLAMQQQNALTTLNISHCSLYDESVKHLADVLLYESLHTLVFARINASAESIEQFLCPALKHPNCKLKHFDAGNLNGAYDPEYIIAMKNANAAFALHLQRETLIVLIQQQQQQRIRKHRLNRLPIEMFHLVGEMLLRK